LDFSHWPVQRARQAEKLPVRLHQGLGVRIGGGGFHGGGFGGRGFNGGGFDGRGFARRGFFNRGFFGGYGGFYRRDGSNELVLSGSRPAEAAPYSNSGRQRHRWGTALLRGFCVIDRKLGVNICIVEAGCR
jgi:hypothetical protein